MAADEPTFADLLRELRAIRAEQKRQAAAIERLASGTVEEEQEVDVEETDVRPKRTPKVIANVEKLFRQKGWAR